MKSRRVWYLVIDRAVREDKGKLSIECYVCRVQAPSRTQALKIFRQSGSGQAGKSYSVLPYRSQGYFLVREQRLIDRTVPELKIQSLW